MLVILHAQRADKAADDRTILRLGVIGTIIIALCCFTPILPIGRCGRFVRNLGLSRLRVGARVTIFRRPYDLCRPAA